MKKKFRYTLLTALWAVILSFGSAVAQPGPPPPPGGPGLNPPPGAPAPPPPPAGQPIGAPAPPPPAGWGYSGYLATPPSADWMNQGTVNVMATGYDTESVLVQIPLVVSYVFNGVNYNVTVLNAWSPFTQTWNVGLDVPASQTSFYFNGFNYNFTVSLPSGVYYFNL